MVSPHYRNISNILPLDIRSAFAQIALTVFIDREPLNEISYPQMCHIHSRNPNSKDLYVIEYNEFLEKPFLERNETVSNSSGKKVSNRVLFEKLINELLDYLVDMKSYINENLAAKYQKFIEEMEIKEKKKKSGGHHHSEKSHDKSEDLSKSA